MSQAVPTPPHDEVGRLSAFDGTPARQVRAVFDDETITVYQAYSAAIATPAAANDSFAGTPFKLDRMTWIKPSFLWMMYRSGWATKPGQEHVLAIQATRTGFEEALALACLSHFDAEVYPDHATWAERKEVSPVRVQWDPERSIALEPLQWRSLQVGLSGSAALNYSNNWIVQIDDVTEQVHEIHQAIAAGRPETARAKLPTERPYPLPRDIATTIGAS
ncbi:DUF4291 domain-containing protein [Kribbella sp. NBC_01245]|uniref:DUF4291 domain-containing protein n=1 Tax=Kribbella sp. NBC_01245 TaxID=2903578 RepID=UPI002E2DF1B0|nr:DUF4291 domain-containing protein [Kribbella sp. NBC_01245]